MRNTPNADVEHQHALLGEIVATMDYELSWAAKHRSDGEAAQNGEFDTLLPSSNKNVLDAVRDFLFRCSVPSARECEMLLKPHVLAPADMAIAGRLSMQDRTTALTSLVQLGFARRSLCDIS